MTTSSEYAIFDIDGCCLSNEGRLHLLPAGAAYHAAWATDKPIKAGVAVYTALMMSGIKGVFLTARPISAESVTRHQLSLLFPGLTYTLLMAPRNQKDHAAFKARSLKDYVEKQGASLEDVVVCFDDNIDVVAAYRELGLVAYQTAKGWK